MAPERIAVEYVPLDGLVPAPYNPRTIDDDQMAALEASIAEFGVVDPIIARREDGLVVGGHQRLDAARRAGLADVPVVFLDALPDEQAKLLNLALNRISGDWDRVKLGAVLVELADLPGLDLALAGFTLPEVRRAELAFRFVNAATDPDDAPPLPADARTQPGDLWLLGDHRLLCGDATSADDVARLLAGTRPLLCVTDPPYGVDYDPGWRNEQAAKGNLSYAASRVGVVPNDECADWSAAWALFPGDVVYSWHPTGAPSLVHAAALQGSGFLIRMQIIWAKSNFPIGRGDYHVRHEPCWYAVRRGQPARRTNDRTQTTLWEINLDRNVEGGHSTQKPVECMERPIRNHEFDEVYDPFVGSGTTIIAAERQGRRCYAMDIEPRYVDVSVARWEAYTGGTATLSEREQAAV